jgi:succinate dehydrogenase/fumarate reductase flavoprotein subunit
MTSDRVDVLVVGFGAAGASAALAARERGASVLVVEKTAAGGGNCRHSGGFLFEVDGPSAVDHLDALCFGKTDREVLGAFANGLHEVPGWLAGLGGRTEAVDPAAFGGMLPSWPHFPGAGHVSYRQYAGGGTTRPGIALWQLLRDSVAGREIPVELETSATDLVIRDGSVEGAVLTRRGESREVLAGGGVVLASGGIEYDAELRDAFLPLPLVPVGHPGNTGDTVRLAQRAGASLWHMSAFFGWLCFRHPEFPAAFTLDVHAPSFIYVDADGRRFADETGWEVHDKVRSWTAFLPRSRNYPHLPGYIIFDEAARLAGPLSGIVGTPNEYVWSDDNSREVQRGWITRGDTPEELARAAGIDPDALGETLASYAAAASDGVDRQFGRSPESIVALEAPLYAIEMWPGLATASGGPRRDARARVLSVGRDPIPGLYAAGAAGSVWGHLTEHGGGLTDAIVFGRIAGAEAASAVV